jgi:hypothetical protein
MSHVERDNGIIRTFMKRFTRLSNGFSKKLENLSAACGVPLSPKTVPIARNSDFSASACQVWAFCGKGLVG